MKNSDYIKNNVLFMTVQKHKFILKTKCSILYILALFKSAH